MDKRKILVNEQWPFFTEAERNIAFCMMVMAVGLCLARPRRWVIVTPLYHLPIILGG